jgi:cytidylate kinase
MKIALDGPSGAGKSSLAKVIAKEMHIVYVDTGALYRSIGLFVQGRGVDPKDAPAVIACLPDIRLEMVFENGEQHIYLCGEDVGDRIRTPEISMYASAVSAIPAVREFLLETQRAIARKSDVIMDGRDIGTVILPDAEVKIFLTASSEARAKRRTMELNAKGNPITYAQVLAEMLERDENDSTRKTAPAVPADDAVFLDNSELTAEETVAAALAIIQEKVKK